MMPEAIHSMLEGDLDRQCFATLVDSRGSLTVDELAERVERDRTTPYRSVRRLLDPDLVARDTVSGDGSSYYHVYDAMLDRFIAQFRATVGERQS